MDILDPMAARLLDFNKITDDGYMFDCRMLVDEYGAGRLRLFLFTHKALEESIEDADTEFPVWYPSELCRGLPSSFEKPIVAQVVYETDERSIYCAVFRLLTRHHPIGVKLNSDYIVFTPHLTEDGLLLWENNGGLENPAPVTIKGADGVSIVSIDSTEVEDGTMVVITLSDSSTHEFTIPHTGGGGSVDAPITKIKVNGAELPIEQKAVNISIAEGSTAGAIRVNGVDVSVNSFLDVTSKLATLIASDANKSVRAIAIEALAAKLIPEDAQAAMDTLEEIAAWIQQHPEDVAAINHKLTLGTHEEGGESVQYSTVKDYVEAVETGLRDDVNGKQDRLSATGAANTGVYIDATGTPQAMTNELNATVPENAVFTDTTYTLTQDAVDGHKLTLTGSDGSTTLLTIPDNDTEYTPAAAVPLMDGAGVVGTSVKYAREDHVHPVDTSRASTAVVTSSSNGLMSAEDKTKLDNMDIPAGGISMPETIANQSMASFTSSAAGRPLRVTAHIEAVQAGSGNPYPQGQGKNLLDISNARTGVDKGITFSFVTDDAGNVTGIKANGVSTAANAQCILAIPDGSVFSNMILSGTPGNIGARMVLEMTASPYTQYASDTGDGATITSIPSGTSCSFILRFPNSGTTVTNAVFNPMIRRASDIDPAFAPYANIRPITGWTAANIYVSPTTTAADETVYTVAFPSSIGTVYSGTLDMARGLLTVTHDIVDLGTLSWELIGNTGYFATANLRNKVKRPASNNVLADAICEAYPVVTLSDAFSNTVPLGIAVQTSPSAGYVAIRDRNKAGLSAADFATSLSGIRFVYQLATPATYQLTPQQLTTLVNTNNVFADCGPVSVTHWPGTGQLIDGDSVPTIDQFYELVKRVEQLEGGS